MGLLQALSRLFGGGRPSWEREHERSTNQLERDIEIVRTIDDAERDRLETEELEKARKREEVIVVVSNSYSLSVVNHARLGEALAAERSRQLPPVSILLVAILTVGCARRESLDTR